MPAKAGTEQRELNEVNRSVAELGVANLMRNSSANADEIPAFAGMTTIKKSLKPYIELTLN